jgi:HD-GYP domain-containing protein (c-di-GMP phosphodiesterase class II)
MHPIWGIELLAAVEFPWDLKPIIRYHHERYDGTGYPDRLRGDAIPLSAQVVGIVDVFDALTTTRPYRHAFSRAAALAQIKAWRGLWSEAVFQAFLTSLAEARARAAERPDEEAPLPIPRLLAVGRSPAASVTRRPGGSRASPVGPP